MTTGAMRGEQSRLLSALALSAPVLDVVGRVLAPSLLAACPLLVLAMSPSDPHLLLARFDPRAVLVMIALAVRVGRAWLIYEACVRNGHALRPGRLRRLLLVDREPSRRSQRGGLVGVLLLPGMPGAAVAARTGLPRRRYVSALVASTVAGLAITLTVASRFTHELERIGRLVTSHPTQATIVVLIAALGGAGIRLRRGLKLELGLQSDHPESN